MLKNCKICGKSFESKNRAKCCSDNCKKENKKAVHVTSSKRWIDKHRDYYNSYFRDYFKIEENRSKQLVREKTYYLQKKGMLKNCPCAICGNQETEAHHTTYDDDLSSFKIVWLCKKCHERLHHEQA